MYLKFLSYSFLFVLLSFFKFKWTDKDFTHCVTDLVKKKTICNLNCPEKSFFLPNMTSCHPWLKCDEKIRIISTISRSVVKTIYLGNWRGHYVILSALSSNEFKDDFNQNLMMLKAVSSHPSVAKLIGYCGNYILTEYYELGSALNLNDNLLDRLIDFRDHLKVRLHLCVNYASILKYLHNSPVGVRVACDSNTLEKTLSQYLLTNDLRLVINDLDATPLVSEKGVICGHKPLSGAFVAPEQVWIYPDQEYNATQMAGYNEKTDIWKLPDVCNWFLGQSSEADVVRYKLFQFHRKCKSTNPGCRPTAADAVKIYGSVLEDLEN